MVWACLLAGSSIGAFAAYAAVAAWNRDWKAFRAFVILLVSLLAVASARTW